MPKKPQPVAEPAPLPHLAAPQADENSRLYRTKAFPFVSEGSVYCFPLREHLVEPTIARGESALCALLPIPAGNVYGLTRGRRSHLCYFHPGFGVADVGVVCDQPVRGGALAHVGNSVLLGGWWGEGGGGAFRHDATGETGQGMEQFRGAKTAVEPLSLPASVGGLAAFAGPDEEGTLYALAMPEGTLLKISGAGAAIEPLARIEDAAPVLVLLPDGRLLGAFAEGRLWEYDQTHVHGLGALDAHAPCQKGKRYVAGVQSLLVARDGMVYGGTSVDGFLFWYDPFDNTITNLGKPNRQSNIRALAEGGDGRLYGVVEEPGGLAHLFAYVPSTRSFNDLGVVASAFPEYWIGHSFGAMATGLNGELFLGESDDISHLFIYYPPLR